MKPRQAILAAVLAASVAALTTGCAGTTPGAASSPARSSAAASPPRPPAASAAYSAQPLPSGRTGTYPVALPSPGSIDRTSADAVAYAAVITMWSMNTATDTSQYQAELRTGWLLAPDYLTALKANPPVGAPGAWWITWQKHQAYSTVTATRDYDDPIPDTATLAYRQYTITATPHGAGGWSTSPQTATAFVKLVRAGAGTPWAVEAVTTSS